MRKILVSVIAFISIIYGIEYSIRMKALGTDFIGLVPDFETDLYINPNLLGNERLSGISYEPGLSSPLSFRLCANRFGWLGRYWGSSFNQVNGSNSITRSNVYLKDLWMLDLRGKLPKFLANEVWNLYNDGSYSSHKEYHNDINFDTSYTIKYLFGGNSTYKLGEHISLIPNVTGGFYFNNREYQYYGTISSVEKLLFIITGNLGLFYRNEKADNKFTSWYLNIGGPLSVKGVDDLPYPIWSHVEGDAGVDMKFTYFARTLVTKIGYARGYPVDSHSFFVIGIRDSLLYQKTYEADTTLEMRGFRNVVVLPVGIEYNIKRITLRIGSRLEYSYQDDKIWESDSTIQRYSEHKLGWGYTAGIGWKIGEHIVLDAFSDASISNFEYWSIYVKYIY